MFFLSNLCLPLSPSILFLNLCFVCSYIAIRLYFFLNKIQVGHSCRDGQNGREYLQDVITTSVPESCL